jgi:chromosome segregation ATPase
MQTLMQMTSDGFIRLEGRMGGLEGRMDGLEGRMDGLEGRMGGLESRMDRLENEVQEIKNIQHQHTQDIRELKEAVCRIENEQKGQGNDIAEILDRLVVLEEKVTLSEAERKEMKEKLEKLVDWAFKIADHCNIPLDLPRAANT